MLVLAREVNQSIRIGDDITLTVVDIRSNGQVRIGIEAPKSIQIHRSEIYDAIARENRAAASVTPGDLAGLGKEPL